MVRPPLKAFARTLRVAPLPCGKGPIIRDQLALRTYLEDTEQLLARLADRRSMGWPNTHNPLTALELETLGDTGDLAA